jgi:hypothetical protein
MSPDAKAALDSLRQRLRKASVADIGGFRPPSDPLASWFSAGVAHGDEGIPTWHGKPMFPLIQVRTSELPFVPTQLQGVELLVLFQNQDEVPFDKPHGEGWLIREYRSLEELSPLPAVHGKGVPRKFPIRWTLVEDDAPGWEDAGDVVDLTAVNADEEASDSFFQDFHRYPRTKVGGYPADIQHGVGIDDFVFQVGSEEKPGWMWADNGIGYFFKRASGVWEWSCQFY